MTSKFELNEWAVHGNELLERSRKILSSASNEKVKSISSRIPKSVLDDKNSVTLVFAGQYSAGKSSIVKVLTGREDIAVGAGITTEETHFYDWNGIKVIDTPGVGTKTRPDHDEIAYSAISKADLLVFVITNELFSSHLAEHFQKLAIEKGRAHEMILVINKMRRCAKGNSPEAQSVIREDIKKILKSHSPEDLRTSFIDAESALESRSEKDAETKSIRWDISGVDCFTENLNDLVRKKGVIGKRSTVLYNLQQLLKEAQESETTDDKDVDALIELSLQQRRALVEAQSRIPRAVEAEIHKSCIEIRQEGRKVADMINHSANTETIDQEFQKSQHRVRTIIDQLEQNIQVMLREHKENVDNRIDGIDNSELAKELSPRLMHRIQEDTISPGSISSLKNSSKVSSNLGAFLTENSFNPNSGSVSELLQHDQFSDTETHDAVQAIGKLFELEFDPWEAVKLTRGIAGLGSCIAIVGSILSFVLQILLRPDTSQLESAIRDSRAEIRTLFNDVAHEIEIYYDQFAQNHIAKVESSKIETVDRRLSELRNMQEVKSKFFVDIESLLEEAQNLIDDLHSSQNQLV